MRYQYKRTAEEDKDVVPFNRVHCNILYVSEGNCIEVYLVKYVSKSEPTFGLVRVVNNEVSTSAID
jgi:hypothetical protein